MSELSHIGPEKSTVSPLIKFLLSMWSRALSAPGRMAVLPSAPAGSARHVQDGVGVLRGPGQHADRLCRRQDDEVDVATAGLFADLLHHRQRAISTGADHQPATSPGDVLRDRQRGVPVRAAEPPGRGLPALADLPAVDDQVVIVGHAVDSYRTE